MTKTARSKTSGTCAHMSSGTSSSAPTGS
jgi:hypothetical protein